MTAPADALRSRIADRSARLAVVGLGYVGTPVACSFADAGFSVVGLDVAADRVAAVSDGRPPFEGREPGLTEMLARVVAAGRLRATLEPRALSGCDVVLVAVETPLDAATRRPAYAALRAALETMGPRLAPGTLVVIESTLAPGTTTGLVVPTLGRHAGAGAGAGLLVAHCPERVMPGRLLHNLAMMSRVVGGVTREAGELAAELYRHIVKADLDVTDALTAEIVKTAENAYRDVQIAFANELALLCESVGADVWRVRELVNKSPGRAVLFPGAGVGGHCIPKDPWLLVAGAGPAFSASLVPAARAVNDGMPGHMAARVVRALAARGLSPAEARIAVLGASYLEDSDDDRNAPTTALVAALRGLGAEVRVHDPWVSAHRDLSVEACVTGVDAVVMMVAHAAYRGLELSVLRSLARTPLLFDGRRVFDPERAAAAGWLVHTLGVGRVDAPEPTAAEPLEAGPRESGPGRERPAGSRGDA